MNKRGGEFSGEHTCGPRLQLTGMPTVLRTGPYRFYFYSHEPNEPPHVHVDREAMSAKFWIDPVALAGNLGFSSRELRVLHHLVQDHQQELLEARHGHFGADR